MQGNRTWNSGGDSGLPLLPSGVRRTGLDRWLDPGRAERMRGDERDSAAGLLRFATPHPTLRATTGASHRSRPSCGPPLGRRGTKPPAPCRSICDWSGPEWGSLCEDALLPKQPRVRLSLGKPLRSPQYRSFPFSSWHPSPAWRRRGRRCTSRGAVPMA